MAGLIAAGLMTIMAAAATPAALPPPPATETIATRSDDLDRMTVDVMVNRSGPYAFTVDTGATRSVVSDGLAARLALPMEPARAMHGMGGAQLVPMARLATLGVGRRETSDIAVPVLREGDLGTSGLLGLDSLAGQRVVIDFIRRTMRIEASRVRVRSDPDEIVVTARSRFGQLVVMDAAIGGVPVKVIVDSGSQVSVGNLALMRRLGQRLGQRLTGRLRPVVVTDVTGGTIPALYGSLPRVRIGRMEVERVSVAFADAHPFALFGLVEQPAMMLGADMLRAFARVSVDFGNRRLVFLPRSGDDAGDDLAEVPAGAGTGG